MGTGWDDGQESICAHVRSGLLWALLSLYISDYIFHLVARMYIELEKHVVTDGVEEEQMEGVCQVDVSEVCVTGHPPMS